MLAAASQKQTFLAPQNFSQSPGTDFVYTKKEMDETAHLAFCKSNEKLFVQLLYQKIYAQHVIIEMIVHI